MKISTHLSDTELGLKKKKWKLLSQARLCNPIDYTVHGIL